MTPQKPLGRALGEVLRSRIFGTPGMSLGRAAKECGIPKSTANGIFQGKADPSPATAAKLAAWLAKKK